MNRIRFLAAAATLVLGAAGLAFAGTGPGAPGGTTPGPTLDTSAAVEASYSCLEGGCHETDAKLLADYRASYMTHVMVKCNACHGTHARDELGQPKPNLTGYRPGSGVVGYVVGKDRCLACHSSALSGRGHPRNPGECTSCHTPHTFRK